MRFFLKSTFVLAFFLVFFIGFHSVAPSIENYSVESQTEFLGFETVNSDTVTYLKRIQLSEPSFVDLKTPFQYVITKAFITVFGLDAVFWLFPFITFFGSIIILLYLFWQFKLEPLLIPLLLSWKITWIIHFINFGRDNWMLLFFTIMVFCMVQVHYYKKTKLIFSMLFVSILATLTKIIGVLFFGVLVGFTLFEYIKKNNFNLSKVHLSLGAAGAVLNDYLASLRNTEVFTLQSLSAIFVDPIHTIALVFAWANKNSLGLFFVFWIVFAGHIIYNFGHDGGTIYRYLFFFFPASAIIIGQGYKKMNVGNGNLFSKGNVLFALFTVFFWLSNFARLAAQLGIRF